MTDRKKVIGIIVGNIERIGDPLWKRLEKAILAAGQLPLIHNRERGEPPKSFYDRADEIIAKHNMRRYAAKFSLCEFDEWDADNEATVTLPTSKFVPQNEYTSDSDDAEDTESGEVLLIDVLPADIAEILAAYDPTLVTRDDVITLCQNSPTNEQALVAIKDIGPARAKAILGALEI